jgi:hypothetical protein
MKTLIRSVVTMACVGLMSSVTFAQAVGDYGSAATNNAWNTASNWVVCVTAGTWAGATTASAAPLATTNIWIRNGHTVTLPGSGNPLCNNLTVESGGVLVSANVVTSPRYLRVSGSTVTNNGTIGGTNDGLGIGLYGGASQVLTFTGSGTTNVSRIQPQTSGEAVVFDANVGVNYAGSSGTGSTALYCANGDFTVTINSGKTVTLAPYAYVGAHTSSGSSAGNAVFTLNINGTLTTGANAHVNLNDIGPKYSKVVVGPAGTLQVGGNLYAYIGSDTIIVNSGGTLVTSTVGTVKLDSAVVTVDGSMTVGNTADFSVIAYNAVGRGFVSGAGSFMLNSGAAIKLGATAGLDPTSGPIRTTTRHFNVGTNYTFLGTTAQVTGPDFPSTAQNLTLVDSGITISNPVTLTGTLTLGGNSSYTNLNNVSGYIGLNYSGTVAQTSGSELPSTIAYLTINNSNGITLGSSVRVDSTLTFSGGKIMTGTNKLTLGALATVSGAGVGKFVDGNVTRIISAPGKLTWPVGKDSVYSPVTLYGSSVTHSGGVSMAVLYKNITPPAGLMYGTTQVYNRYIHTVGDTSLQFNVDSVAVAFSAVDSIAGVYQSDLQVARWNGYYWVHMNVNAIDSTNRVITVSGNIGGGDWILTGPAGFFFYSDTTIKNFGTVSPTLSKTDSIVITNVGNRTLTVDSIRTTNPMFVPTPPTNASIAPSASHTFYFSFSPTGPGVKTGYIGFYNSGLNGTDFVQVNGTGGDMTVFTEDFTGTAGTALTSAGWIQSGSTSTNPVAITSGGLSFPHYNGSNVGNAVTLATSGQDVYASFPTINSGSVYLAFMVNVTSAATGDYFIALSPSTAQTNYYARLHIKSTTGGYLLGISKSNEVSGGAQYGAMVFNLNTTTLVVVKYTFVPAAGLADTTNDLISVFGFASDVPPTEPGTPEINSYGTATKADASDLGYVTLRQGTSSTSPALVIDGLRIGTTWGFGVPTAVTKIAKEIPSTYELRNNYPNPFNPSTTIQYDLPYQSLVTLKIYSILGQEVRTLVNDIQNASYHRIQWNGRDNSGLQVSSGVYFYRINAQPIDGKGHSFIQVRKMMLMK